jgi:hypothetical protein
MVMAVTTQEKPGKSRGRTESQKNKSSQRTAWLDTEYDDLLHPCRRTA